MNKETAELISRLNASRDALKGLSREAKAQQRTTSVWREIDRTSAQSSEARETLVLCCCAASAARLDATLRN